jgi:hypothetical protein
MTEREERKRAVACIQIAFKALSEYGVVVLTVFDLKSGHVLVTATNGQGPEGMSDHAFIRECLRLAYMQTWDSQHESISNGMAES